MPETSKSRKKNVKLILGLIITMLLLAMIYCFFIGKPILGCVVGFVLMALFSVLYRVYGYDNSIYVDRHGYSTDYDHSKLPKDF